MDDRRMARKRRASCIVVLQDVHGRRSVLLARQRRYPHALLPGGSLNRNEPPMAAAARELTEETGLQGRLAVHLFDHESRSLLHSVFLIVAHAGDYSPRDDVEDLFELSLEDLEECSTALGLSWSTADILRRFSAWRIDHADFFESVLASTP